MPVPMLGPVQVKDPWKQSKWYRKDYRGKFRETDEAAVKGRESGGESEGDDSEQDEVDEHYHSFLIQHLLL